MNFDFLVFPSPKCTYSPKLLGKQLIFIPKYDSEMFPRKNFDKTSHEQEKKKKMKEIQLVSKKMDDSLKFKTNQNPLKEDICEFSEIFFKTLESCDHADENEEFSENKLTFEYPQVSIKKYSEVYQKNLSYDKDDNTYKVIF